MIRYTINKIYKYTETVEVEAESSREALSMSNNAHGERNNDDYLHDAEVISEVEIEEQN